MWIADQLKTEHPDTVTSKLKNFDMTIEDLAVIANALAVTAREYLSQKPKILENVKADFTQFSRERRTIKEVAVLAATVKKYVFPD